MSNVKNIFIALFFSALSAGNANALTTGQVDDFEDGTTQSWATGAFIPPPPPNFPVNVSTDGPAGVGDNFLKLTSSGGPSAGGKLTAFNFLGQWSGDYTVATGAGIGSIMLDVRNVGPSTLSLRLGFLDVDVTALPTVEINNFAISTNAVELAADNMWKTISFSLSELTAAVGTVDGALANVDALRIFHSPSGAFPGPPSVSELGVDNIRAVSAVPVPPALLLLGSGFAFIANRMRRRRVI